MFGEEFPTGTAGPPAWYQTSRPAAAGRAGGEFFRQVLIGLFYRSHAGHPHAFY
jgi:hypothetical protein